VASPKGHDKDVADLKSRAGKVEDTNRAQDEVNTGLRTRLTNVEKDIAKHLDLYKNLSKQIDAVNSAVVTLKDRLDSLHHIWDALGVRIDTNRTSLDVLAARVATLETPR
jgi:uncharacterized protein YaaN involved in tellurite resistance